MINLEKSLALLSLVVCAGVLGQPQPNQKCILTFDELNGDTVLQSSPLEVTFNSEQGCGPFSIDEQGCSLDFIYYYAEAHQYETTQKLGQFIHTKFPSLKPGTVAHPGLSGFKHPRDSSDPDLFEIELALMYSDAYGLPDVRGHLYFSRKEKHNQGDLWAYVNAPSDNLARVKFSCERTDAR